MEGLNAGDGSALVPPESQSWPNRILMWHYNGSWVNATNNVKNLCADEPQDPAYPNVGCDMAFAHTLVAHGVSQRVGLIQAAEPSTALYSDWPAHGQLWNDMVNRTAAAMQASNGTGRLQGLLWVQVSN